MLYWYPGTRYPGTVVLLRGPVWVIRSPGKTVVPPVSRSLVLQPTVNSQQSALSHSHSLRTRANLLTVSSLALLKVGVFWGAVRDASLGQHLRRSRSHGRFQAPSSIRNTRGFQLQCIGCTFWLPMRSGRCGCPRNFSLASDSAAEDGSLLLNASLSKTSSVAIRNVLCLTGVSLRRFSAAVVFSYPLQQM